MAAFDAFIGGFYQALSPIAASDQAINIYRETRQVEGSPKTVTLYGTPGLKLETTVATAGCRGWFTQDGRTWVVVGETLYERTAVATYASRGTITNDGLFVSFASNGAGGDQLCIVGGGGLYVLGLLTNVLTPVALPFSNPVMIVFQDGYGLVNEADTPTVWYSALENFTSWDALDFFARSATSDNIVALAVTRDRVCALGTKTSTWYYDSGDTDTPWLPYPGTTMQVGIITAAALSVYNDTLYWLGRSASGQPRMITATADAGAKTFSTPPIEVFLSACSTLDDADTLVYDQEGHQFVVLTCPSSTAELVTYAFDIRENEWAARAGWSAVAGTYTRWRARGCTASGQDILVGDYASGALYTLNLSTYLDNGVMIPRERIAPYLGDTPQWAFIDEVQLLAQAGVGLSGAGQGSDPKVELLISRDGAQTWISAGFASLGQLGDYLTRTIWHRLGRARQDLLVIRVRQTDPVKTAWVGMNLTMQGGTGQL